MVLLNELCAYFLGCNVQSFSKIECVTSVTHYDDVIMTMLASQITSLMVVYSIVYSGANQRKHQSSASLAFVREIHRGPVNFPHKWPVTRKMFPFDDVIMFLVDWWLPVGPCCKPRDRSRVLCARGPPDDAGQSRRRQILHRHPLYWPTGKWWF